MSVGDTVHVLLEHKWRRGAFVGGAVLFGILGSGFDGDAAAICYLFAGYALGLLLADNHRRWLAVHRRGARPR